MGGSLQRKRRVRTKHTEKDVEKRVIKGKRKIRDK